MTKKARTVLILLALLLVLPMAVADGHTDYDDRVQAFLANARFRPGSGWYDWQRCKLSSWKAYSSMAFAADAVAYLHGVDDDWQSAETRFTDPNEIRSGDVLYFRDPVHWVVVLYRRGDTLVTAEGNYEGRVVFAEDAYTLSDAGLCREGTPFVFARGFHFR